MKNQILVALAAIQKRIESRRGEKTFEELLESNKTELAVLGEKFKISEEEALFFAGICIRFSEQNSEVISISDLVYALEVNHFEVLLHQIFLKSLVEKEILIEFKTEDHANPYIYELKAKTFAVNIKLRDHFN